MTHANEQSNRDAAVALALQRAQQELAGVDLPQRCRDLELCADDEDAIPLRLLDRRFTLHPDLRFEPDVDPVSKTLTLRYLARSTLPRTGDTPLAYRELPGAAFYLGPFRSRSVIPLAAKVGGDFAALEAALADFSPQRTGLGDASWRVPVIAPQTAQVLGRAWLELVCYEPDEEFDASCELLFAPAVADVYSADEAAMLGTLLCMGLLRRL